MTRHLLFAAALLATLGFAPAPFPRTQRDAKQDPTDVAGTWVFTAIEHGGVPQPKDFSNFRVTMTRDRIVFDTESRTELGMTLDPTATPPTFVWTRGGTPQYAGVYRLHGGEMTVAFALSGDLAQAPRSFDRPPYKYVFRRVSR